MRLTEVRRVLMTWARPDTCLEVLARTGAILPGCSTEVLALLQEVRAVGSRQGYTAQDVDDLGALWEWIERTGPRPAQDGWAYAHHD